MVPIDVVGFDSNRVSPRSVRVKHSLVVCSQNKCIVVSVSQVLVD